MEPSLCKGLLVGLLLHLCQGQDPAIPSPSPESALPSLDDVMDAVKAAFLEAVKISKDDAVRTVFEQVVEELGTQEDIEEKPPATAYDTEDGLPAVVHEHADKETINYSEGNAKQDPKLNSSDKTLLLLDEEELRHGPELGQEPGENPVESIFHVNKSAEDSVLEVEDPGSNLAQGLVESTHEPKESFVLESEDNHNNAELDESQVWSFESAVEEQAGVDEGKQDLVESELLKAQDTDGIEAMEEEDGWEKEAEADMEAKIQKDLLEATKQTQPQPAQDQKHGLMTDTESKVRIEVEEERNEDEHQLEDVGGQVETKEEDMEGEAEAQTGKDKGLIPVSETSQELATDVTHETNHLSDVVTSRDPVPNWEVPTLGIDGRVLPPFPTLGVEVGDSDELVEEPADKTETTTPKQEAWKIGVIAVAFFLILQTLVTITYILRCRRKRNSGTVPERVCENGTGAAEHDVANASIDEQTMLDDLPERTPIQQETFAMTPTHIPVVNSYNQ